MNALQSILLATDLLPNSREVGAVAAHLATRFGSRVTLLHVWEPLPGWSLTPRDPHEPLVEPFHQFGRELAQQDVMVAGADIEIGSPAQTIIRKAEEVDANLILIGTGGTSPQGHQGIGPVAQAVLEHARRPVLAVRPGEPPMRCQRIVSAVDHSSASRSGLQNAIRLTRAYRGQLCVLSVVPEVSWLTAAVQTKHLIDAREAHARKWEEEFDGFVERVDFGSLRWSRKIRHGEADEEILATCQEERADLLVMGATGRSNLARFLMGSVTRRVMRDLPCSLLVVRPDEAIAEAFEEDVRAFRLFYAEGLAFLQVRSYAMAATRFRQALARNPFHVQALEGLASALDHLGNRREAELLRQRARLVQAEAIQGA